MAPANDLQRKPLPYEGVNKPEFDKVGETKFVWCFFHTVGRKPQRCDMTLLVAAPIAVAVEPARDTARRSAEQPGGFAERIGTAAKRTLIGAGVKHLNGSSVWPALHRQDARRRGKVNYDVALSGR